MWRTYIFSLLAFLSISLNAIALDFNSKTEHVSLSLTPEYSVLSPNLSEISFITTVDIKPNWHIYWDNPGDSGDPTILTYYDSPHYTIKDNTHSSPLKSVFNDIITSYIHKERLYYKTDFKLKGLDKLKNLSFHLVLSYTVCEKECLPEIIDLNFSLPISDNAQKNLNYIEHLSKAELTFPKPLNISSFTQKDLLEIALDKEILEDCQNPEFISFHKKKSILANLPKTHITDNYRLQISFDKDEAPSDANGVLLCSNSSYELKENRDTLKTPTTPENSLLYYLLTALLAGLILNLMPCVLPVLSLKAIYLAQHKEKASITSAVQYLLGVLSSFLILSGLLFYLRSIGSELGWGFQLQSPAFNIFLMLLFFLIFLNLTDKIALPDSFSNKLSKLSQNNSFLIGFFAVIIACPCTGPFMGAALGYALVKPPLIYFGIFLSLGLGYALPYALIESFPAFFLKFIPKPGHWMITLKRILSVPIALTCLWLGWITYNQLSFNSPKEDIIWEPYSPKKVEEALKADEPVLIDFTAKWCLICLLNDKTTLATADFKNLVQQKHIRLFKADWTNRNKEITTALKSYGRNSIPLYVYYKKGSNKPIYLPQILTTEILNTALK